MSTTDRNEFSYMGRRFTVKYAIFNAASGTDTAIVAAVTGKKIRVLAFSILLAGAGTWRLESGAGGTALTGVMSSTIPLTSVFPFTEVGWLETLSGQSLSIEMATTTSAGFVVYTEV